jgi:steroid delta-isomerase-like uncharacterized protein
MSDTTTVPESATAVQREMFALIERGELEALRELLHPDYTYTGEDGVEQAGADAGVAVAQLYTTAFPDLRFEIVAAHDAGDVGVCEIRARGTHAGPLAELAPTGRAVEVVLCNVVEVREGRIRRERDYFDGLSLMRQLGVAD